MFQMVLGLACSSALRAEPTPQDNIKQAIQAGQLEQALKLLQQERQIAPKDVPLRFLEGVIQAQQGQTDKAIETFKKLTESNPDLSEAYNNLGVLYAAKGKLEESRSNLEKALQTHPSYAAAHRNLSDVQSQLAKQTYAKALQIDSKVKNSAPQLTLLGSIDPQKRAPVYAQVQTTSAAPPVGASSIESAKPAPAASTSPSVPAAVVTPTTPSTPAAQVAAAKPSTPAAAEAPKAEPKKEDAQQKHAKTDQTDVRNAVSAWAKAWSQKDMARYLGAYASSFSPPDKMSRAKWESDRQIRIVSKKTINVEINALKIEVSGNKASARFQQVYESDNFKGNSHKTLEMIKQGDRWLITRETVN
ncbi:tetratricopeptide repeat protein [Limnohabitans sp. Jir72]|uniref:YybH family protein n=1 Tax=Limnohabitans sp. Jir72 TaxID=1977909 RepID=UPI00130486F7|nr:nuclear transport factor 2 family protein [Limnohabitans sp. Jir72]